MPNEIDRIIFGKTEIPSNLRILLLHEKLNTDRLLVKKRKITTIYP